MKDITIAAAIILYHPEDRMIEYILNLRQYFGTIYLFDNTESEESVNKMRRKFRIDGIKYAAKNDNMGLAYGLNVCCNAAYKDGFSWIMLFDQDSIITEELLDNMKEFIKEYDEEKLAIVAPMIDDFKNRSVKEKKAKRKKDVITSGMILKLEAFKANGYFLNALFVDAVDYEYCLRLKEKGFFILENKQAILRHNQYDKEKVLGGYKINKYSPLRHYYMARGYCYVLKRYGYDKIFIEKFKKINYQRFWGVLFYDNHRIKKVLAMLLGVLDFKLNRFGRCSWKILF